MRLRSIFVTVLLFLFFFSFCRISFADGYYVPELYVKLPDIPVQRALIKYRGGVETLIVESTLDGPGQKFGWIIPVPSVPQRFEKITPGVLKTLSFSLQPSLTDHRARTRDGAFLRLLFPFLFLAWAVAMFLKCLSILRKGCSDVGSIIKFDLWLALATFVGAPFIIMVVLPQFAGYGSSGPLPAPTTVRVESRHAVGDYEISVVTAEKSSDLNNWLEDNGFRSFPDRAVPAVDDYIAKNWAFIAAKIIREGQGTATPHPILIEFKADSPVYPMRLTALSDSAVNLELFVLAEEEAVPVGYDLKKKYSDYFDYESSHSLYRFGKENVPLYVARAKGNHRSIADTIGHPLAMKLMWNGCVLTKLAGEVSSEQMKEDMFFWLKPAASYRYHVYSSQWVIERGIIVAIFIGLFGLQGLCFLYGTRERVSRLLIPGMLIVCLAIFFAIYFSFEKVGATSQFTAGDWRNFVTEIDAFMADHGDKISDLPDAEISTYLDEHGTSIKNILTNETVVIEDSPGNITLERNGLKRSLILYMPNGTPDAVFEFVVRIDDVSQLSDLLDLLKENQYGHLRDSVSYRIRELNDPQAVDLLISKLNDEDAIIRENAAWMLGQLHDRRALEPLLVALKDQNEGVREAAATSLGKLRESRAVEPLIEALKDKNWSVRNSALHGLAEIDDPRTVEALIAALNMKSLRLHAVDILRKKKEGRAVEPLIALLADDNASVRERAAEALGQIKDSRAVDPLIPLLRDKNTRVRERAVVALGNIGDSRAVGPLIAVLKDSSRKIRAYTASALGRIRDPRAVEPLIVTLKDKYAQVRTNAAGALEKIGDKRAVKPLQAAALNDPQPWVRKRAASAVRKIERRKRARSPLRKRERRKSTASAPRYITRDRSYYETKIAQLKDEDYRVRNRAVWALIRSQNPQALEALIAAQQDEDPSVRVRVAWALSKKNDLRGLGTLLAALKDESPEIRSLAAGFLKEIQDPLVVEALITALQDESSSVRTRATIALGSHRDPRVVCALIEAVNDSNSQVRWWAIHGLKKMDTEITAALKDKNSCVHGSILKTVHKTDDLRTAEELITALQDKDQVAQAKTSIALRKQRMQAPARRIVPLEQRNNRVRDRTPKSLHKTDDPRTAEELIAALQDKNEIVRAEAAVALGQIREPRAFEALILALADEHYRVQHSAWRTLEKIDDPRVVEALVGALQHRNPRVRLGAAYALSERKDRRGLQNLLVLVKDEDPRVRGETLVALKQIKDPRAVEALIAALQDESAPVRVRAAIGLGHQGNPRALHPLIAALDDSEPGVRMWAGRALQRMASQLVAELDAKDPEVRRTAARALREITQKDLGEDSAEWQEWWEQNKKTATEGG